VSRPTVHEAAGVPAEVEQELADSFELVDVPEGADGVITTPAIPVDAAFPRRCRATAPDRGELRGRARQHRSRRDARAGVVVSNTPGVLTNTTAEHAVGLMLALLRRIVEGDRSLRRRDDWEWGPDFFVGEGLEGKEVLVVGRGGSGGESASSWRRTGRMRASPVATTTCTSRSRERTSSACTAR
jgi:phosphoglycerate dehydrogenase-like enzyme